MSQLGMLTVYDLMRRSVMDPLDRNPYDPCWHWLGAMGTDGRPRIWTIDYDRNTKRCMCGPKAVFYIAHNKPLGERLAYRKCGTADCVNPRHHATAGSRREILDYVVAQGWRKGTHLETRRQAARKARLARAETFTPDEVVLAIRNAPPLVKNVELVELLGLTPQMVSKIRRGKTRQGVVA